MSKFRDTPPSSQDHKVIPFHASGERTLAQRAVELDAFEREAHAELMLRFQYHSLMETLASINTYDPVPDNWRAKLQGRDPLDLAGVDGDEDAEADEDEDQDD